MNIPPDTMADIMLARSHCHDEAREYGFTGKYVLQICDQISDYIERCFRWRCVGGFFEGPEESALHYWNVGPDGTIIDASADQFGFDAVLIIPPGDPRQAWYKEGDL